MVNKRPKIEELVWYELVHAKYWEQYISDYTGAKIDRRTIYNVIAIVFAIIGGSTWGVWKALDIDWITPLTFGIMGVAQILSAIQKTVIIDTETIQALAKLRSQYIEYYNKLERLFIKIEDGQLDKFEIEDEYFKLRESVYSIENLKDSLNIRELKKVNNKVQKRVTDDLVTKFYK